MEMISYSLSQNPSRIMVSIILSASSMNMLKSVSHTRQMPLLLLINDSSAGLSYKSFFGTFVLRGSSIFSTSSQTRVIIGTFRASRGSLSICRLISSLANLARIAQGSLSLSVQSITMSSVQMEVSALMPLQLRSIQMCAIKFMRAQKQLQSRKSFFSSQYQ